LGAGGSWYSDWAMGLGAGIVGTETGAMGLGAGVVGAVTGLWAGRSGFRFPARCGDFHFSKASVLPPAPTQGPVHWVPAVLPAGVPTWSTHLPSQRRQGSCTCSGEAACPEVTPCELPSGTAPGQVKH
jgi:hypothetical protein